MNVLILTPDRVGSTLLQRLLTIYMNMQDFDRPTINLHELTNGLIKYLNPRFNQEVLGKPNAASDWGYYQTLPEIVELLSSVTHYKTTRLAHYHIRAREDSIKDQLGLYQYLNENFFIISAQRENLLEHALSWCIQIHSKRLNVYSHAAKISIFHELYRNKITVEPESMVKYLDQYKDYLDWVDRHFQVGSYFKYERDLPNIEKYILDLPVFNNQPKLNWESNFGISWEDWNQCHYLLSDLSGLGNQVKAPLMLENSLDTPEYSLTVSDDQNAIINSHNELDRAFLEEKLPNYKTVDDAIRDLVDNKVLVTSVPIKLQTLAEKRLLIKNFDQCVEVYNQWVEKNGVGKTYTTEALVPDMIKELQSWHCQPRLT